MLLGFGFLNWAMLGWLAAASLPLLIHLWNRRQHREVPWAAAEFLLAALRKNARRLRLEQWLLLAVRTLLILLIVFAVAQPYMEQLGLIAPNVGRTHKVIVVDGTFSMGFKPADRSRFQRAKQLATQIVEESPQGDAFSLVLLGKPPRVVVGTPAFEPNDFVEEIENLQLPHTAGDLPATLQRVQEIVERAEKDNPRLTQTEVYFISDLGRATWVGEAEEETTADEFRNQAKRLSELAALVLLDVGQPDAENLAVTDVRLMEPFVTTQEPVRFEVILRNFGRQDQIRRRTEFVVDGRAVAQEDVDLTAGEDVVLNFAHRFETPGDHVVECRLSGDLLDIDNHRWMSLAAKEQIDVLCVDGSPSGDALGGAAGYLAVALAPKESTFGGHVVRPQVVPETSLLEADLSSFDCIFLCNVGQFTRREAHALESYLEGGGGLVCFLGDRVQIDSYNRHLHGEAEGESPILPARLIEVVAENQYSLDPLDYQHPIVQAFRGQQQAGLLTTPVKRYVRLDVSEDPDSSIALATSGGDPMIVQAPRDRGTVILVATSADVSWTAMPVWPSYLPLVQELLAAAVRGQLNDRNTIAGSAIGASVRSNDPDRAVAVRLPDGDDATVRVKTSADGSNWTFADTQLSGVYSVSQGSPGKEPLNFAVNVDPVESDLTKLDVSELRTDIWPGVPFLHSTTWQDTEGQPMADAVRRGQFHRALLYAVLALLFAEIALATYMGRRSI